MKKTKLFSIALVLGALGLTACGNTGYDPFQLGNNLVPVNKEEASLIYSEAVTNFAKVESLDANISYTSDTTKFYAGVYSQFAKKEEVSELMQIDFRKSSAWQNMSNKAKETSYIGTVSTEQKRTSNIWFDVPSNPLMSDYISMYAVINYEDGGLTSTDYGENVVCKKDQLDLLWSKMRYEVSSSTYASIGITSSVDSMNNAFDGESSFVFYEQKVTKSTSVSEFVGSSNTEHYVIQEDEQLSIIRLVKDETFGWIVSSVAHQTKTNYLTDPLGVLLDEPINCEKTSGYVKYTYVESLAENKTHPEFVKQTKSSNSLSLNTFDASTYARTNTAAMSNISTALLYEDANVTDNKFLISARLNSSYLYSIGDVTHSALETPVYDVWGYGSITKNTNSSLIANPEVSGHNFFKVLKSGYYQIDIVLDKDYSTVKSLVITYCGQNS